MRFDIDEVNVVFPHDYIYPEQYQYMVHLKTALDAGGHAVLEMPSGTGKTAALLALVVAYLRCHPARYSKLVYCTRTVPEVDKVLTELAALYRADNDQPPALAIALASRQHLCINPSVRTARDVDRACHALTSPNATGSCPLFENLEEAPRLPTKVHDLASLREYGTKNSVCPYFAARRAVLECRVLVYSYAYLVDPKVAGVVSREIEPSAVVVFDEAHNIDNACLEAFSVTLDQNVVIAARSALEIVSKRLELIRRENRERLESEYANLLEGLQKLKTEQDFFLPNPVVSQEILTEAVPGNIRKGEHFVSFLSRLVELFAVRMCSRELVVETPDVFLRSTQKQVGIDRRSLRFCSERLRSLLTVLEIDGDAEVSAPLGVIASFGTIVSTHEKGFCVIVEPFDPSKPNVPRPRIYLNCLDACLSIRPVFERFRCLIVTSGTLSPLSMYPRLLDFRPVLMASLSVSHSRQNVLPLIVTKGSDQSSISCRFADRFEPATVRNYGLLVAGVCASVPDGVVVFFTSYRHMEAAIAAWSEMGLISRMQSCKLVFAETPNSAETNLALDGYRRACECGRGGLLFSIARGKVSEGIDFYDHLGRAVIVIGVPYVFTLSSTLRTRLDYLRDNHGIKEADFLTFDAMRHAAQCIGRVLRSKTDYGVMILADHRFSKPGKIKKLPKWIQDNLLSSNVNLSTDDAIQITIKYLKEMAQPLSQKDQLGVSLISAEDLKSEKFQNRLKALQEASLEAANNQE